MKISSPIEVFRHQFRIPVEEGIALERFVYSYIIYGETITLIDTGVSGGEAKIFESIMKRGRKPSEIALIILTHSHPDHIGAALTIQQATSCDIAAHPAERGWIENVDLQNRERPVPGFDMLVSGSVKLDHELVDADSIEIDDDRALELQVIHTPGHSPGSISLFMHNTGALFSGDAIPVAGDLPVYDDALESVKSVKRLHGLYDIRVLFSAWDEPRKEDETYLQMDRAIDYLQTIHEKVLANADSGYLDLMDLTRKTAADLGLPPQAVNPLLARTFAGNLRVRERKRLI